MPQTKDANIIADFLIEKEVPYVFGICGHGNVSMPDIV
jgi:acetolactate synthase I/II/III large subunit